MLYEDLEGKLSIYIVYIQCIPDWMNHASQENILKNKKKKKVIELMYIFCATESETTAESETRHVEAG